MLCTCPPASALTDIAVDNCLENVGQIQKLIFQRTKTGSTINVIDLNPDLLATWTTLKSAVDSTKIVVTPYIQNPVTEAGEPREFGGGNATLGGIPVIIGRNPSTFTAEFHRVKQAIVKTIKSLECETELSVFLVSENGAIVCLADDPSTPTEYRGIPIRSFFVGDKTLGGFEEVDRNTVAFQMLPNWSDDLVQLELTDGDPLTQL